ncbi:MAG: imidazolonepropionase [Lachnospiraceae bacterium]|jgi:imidazolonepropionase|nr:imidazolonepropionase [Lachnospiraceae bacterium]
MKKIIIHIPELVTCAGKGPKYGKDMADAGIIKDGAVVVVDGKFAFVGTTEELKKVYGELDEEEVIDASGCAVIPGLVDSHTHFIFGGYRADEFSWRLKGDSYMSIMERGGGIASTMNATRGASEQELLETGKERLDRMLSYGITTVEGKSGYGMDYETELRMLRVMKKLNQEHAVDIVPTFLGPHAIPPEYAGRDREFIDFNLKEVMPKVKEENLAEFADIFTEKGVFSIEDSRYYLRGAKELGFRLKVHADEIVDLGGASMAVEEGCQSADHLLMASDASIEKLAKGSTVATLLPATAFSLGAPYAKGRQMIDSGCAVAIASDYNPGSCHTCSIPLIIAISCIYMHMTIEEVLNALTINGAAAVNRQDSVGSIEVGKKADLVMLDKPSIHFLPYCTAMNIVKSVMKDGKFVF